MKIEPHPIPDPFHLTDKTRQWLRDKYPNLDEDGQEELFASKMTNAIDKDKRSPYYNQVVHAVNWQRKFMEFVRIAATNKWTGSLVPKQGHEVDMRWQETMAHAKAIGCPIERRSVDSVESFRTRVKNWEMTSVKTTRVIDFDALKKMAKS